MHELARPRRQYLDTARKISRLTLPYLYPEPGTTSERVLTGDWNSTGARGLVEMSGKVTAGILPAGQPFHQLSIVLPAEAQDDERVRAQLLLALKDAELEIQEFIERANIRRSFPTLVQHVAVAGSALIDWMGDKPRVRGLSSFVWDRDARRQYLEFITVDLVDRRTLKSPAAKRLADKLCQSKTDDYDPVRLHLFHWARYQGDGEWEIDQHLAPIGSSDQVDMTYWDEPRTESEVIPKSRTVYDGNDPFPLIPVTVEDIEDELYGRAPAELILGDLKTVSGLTEDVVAASGIAAETRFGVRPGSRTRIEDLEETPLGGFFVGDPDDLFVFSAREHLPDLSFAGGVLAQAEQRLERFFLSDFALRRAGERVTATEILELAQALDRAQSSLYAGLSDTQRDIAEYAVRALVKEGRFPERLVDRETVKLEIITGMDALSGSQSAQRLRSAIGTFAELGLMPQLLPILQLRNIAVEVFRAHGIDETTLVRSEREIQEMRQQAEQAQMRREILPEAARAQIQARAQQ
jgi:hypothetical protein